MAKHKDISGHRFGRLVAKEHVGSTGQAQHALWRCVCDCGKEIEAAGAYLRRGNIKSCGCLQEENYFQPVLPDAAGMAKNRTYRIWYGMHKRCAPNAYGKSRRLYFERGIRVCEDWKDFSRFLSDMGEAPAGHSIDRIDGNKGYEPSNCRWATPIEQANNTSANSRIEFNGTTKTVAMWAREIGIPQNTLLYRLRRGIPLERAMQKEIGDARSQRAQARERNCLVCGTAFIPRPAQVRNGGGLYCSQACNGKARAKKK